MVRLYSTVVLLIVICCATERCQAYQRRLANATNPDYPGECYDPESGIHLAVDETKFNKKCERLECDNDFTLVYSGCGVLAPPEGCHLSPIDYSKNYPDCCPEPVCEKPKPKCSVQYENNEGPKYPSRN